MAEENHTKDLDRLGDIAEPDSEMYRFDMLHRSQRDGSLMVDNEGRIAIFYYFNGKKFSIFTFNLTAMILTPFYFFKNLFRVLQKRLLVPRRPSASWLCHVRSQEVVC